MMPSYRSAWPFLLLILSGCAELPNRIVSLGGLVGCHEITEERLLSSAVVIGPNTPTDELQCAMSLARSSSQSQGGPLRLLGMLYLKAPPWPTGIGDGDKALALLKDAVSLYPDHPLNHLFYAEALYEVDEKTQDAKNEIQKGQLLLTQGAWGFNREIWKKEFADVIQEVNKASR